MRALKSEDLISILDFLYFGEANVFQENLHSFLLLAQELKLKGLTTVADEINKHQKFSRDQKFKRKSSVEIKSSPKYQEISSIKEESSEMKSESFSPGSHQPYPNFDTTDTRTTVNTSLEALDMQISSMITKSGVSIGNGKLATCNICGKEGPYSAMPRHVEAYHITGVSHVCDICGSISRSINRLKQHVIIYHNQSKLSGLGSI